MPDAASFAQELKASAMRYYGAPAREFLRQLLPHLQDLPDQSRNYRASFMDASVPQDADGQVKRVATRFALVAMAGELATEFGLTGWLAGAATEATQTCFVEWLRERGGTGAAEIMKARQAIMTAIERDGQSRFVPWKADAKPFIRNNTLGYARHDEETGERTYYLHKSGMAELLGSLDRKSAVNGLADQGVIVRREMMRNGRRVQIVMPSIKVPSEGTNKRLYEISRSFVNGDLDRKDD